MRVIAADDIVQSIADALQFVSYYHPRDFVEALKKAYRNETSPAAKMHFCNYSLIVSLVHKRSDRSVRTRV